MERQTAELALEFMRMLLKGSKILILLLLLMLCVAEASESNHSSGVHDPFPDPPIPLIDMGDMTYLGFSGGLYPNGLNTMPPQHAQVGFERARYVLPLDTNGNPHPSGRSVLLSIGMSNTAQEFCGSSLTGVHCHPWSFIGQSAQDPNVDHQCLVFINGAKGGQSAEVWDDPTAPNYDRIRDTILLPLGLSEQQVQIVWLKVANPVESDTPSLPSPHADAYRLLSQMGDTVRTLKLRYPNVQQVFVSSRIYAGYARTLLNPEPYAYESGFAVKWLIEAQIRQMQSGGQLIDALAGDLNYTTVAPWLAWGPYLWAEGLVPRSDGLLWRPADFESDGTHPSRGGEQKAGTMLLNFFKTSLYTQCWFLVGQTCSGVESQGEFSSDTTPLPR